MSPCEEWPLSSPLSASPSPPSWTVWQVLICHPRHADSGSKLKGRIISEWLHKTQLAKPQHPGTLRWMNEAQLTAGCEVSPALRKWKAWPTSGHSARKEHPFKPDVGPSRLRIPTQLAKCSESDTRTFLSGQWETPLWKRQCSVSGTILDPFLDMSGRQSQVLGARGPHFTPQVSVSVAACNEWPWERLKASLLYLLIPL